MKAIVCPDTDRRSFFSAQAESDRRLSPHRAEGQSIVESAQMSLGILFEWRHANLERPVDAQRKVGEHGRHHFIRKAGDG